MSLSYFLVSLFIAVLSFGGGYYLSDQINKSGGVISPLGEVGKNQVDFSRYTIPALRIRGGLPGSIILGEPVSTQSGVVSAPFYFFTAGRKVTGLAHLPVGYELKKLPVIVQIRGYVDRQVYKSGDGTRRSAQAYAAAGFASLAPDFLGYGGSDQPSGYIFEERFQTYTTVLDLLASLDSLPFIDTSRVGLWGHSNGGQVVLTVLTILGRPLPAVVWAPVSRPFPYSVLYYSDELPDQGRYLRRELANLESQVDVGEFGFASYLGWLQAPIQLHQGAADEAVPLAWSRNLADELKKAGRQVNFYVYPGADHNLMPGWGEVVIRDLQFFRSSLK